MSELKLNLGAGGVALPGYEAIDIKTGTLAYPLSQYADGSVDEVRASHLLEHYGDAEAFDVLTEWVRVLKPGGVMRLAVPDFAWIAKEYSDDDDPQRSALLRAYLMGGQTDATDFHKSAWSKTKLTNLLRAVGIENIEHWQSDVQDCAALPVSLNLCGVKSVAHAGQWKPKITAVLSVPRLCFVDNMFQASSAFIPFGISLKRHTSAFWQHSLTRLLEESIAEGNDFIFTVDYDTLFCKEDVSYMVRTLGAHPEMDAISGVQIKREVDAPLCTVMGEDGLPAERVPLTIFQSEFTQLATSHFGLTLLRASAFADLAKPWFIGEPGPDGGWNEGRTDPDIHFWKVWGQAGKTLYQANKVRLGHMQLMATWPTKEFRALHQYVNDYVKHGMPEEVRV